MRFHRRRLAVAITSAGGILNERYCLTGKNRYLIHLRDALAKAIGIAVVDAGDSAGTR